MEGLSQNVNGPTVAGAWVFESNWIAVLTMVKAVERFYDYLSSNPVCSSVTARKKQDFVFAKSDGCPIYLVQQLSQRVGFTRTAHKIFACDKEAIGSLQLVLDHIIISRALDNQKVRLHSINRKLQDEIGDYLEASSSFLESGALCSPADFSVVLVMFDLEPDRWVYGIWSEEQYREVLVSGRESICQKDGLNHAEYKMQEAVQMISQHRQLDRSHAVDVGAAPGGWTRFLAVTHKFDLVTAIDPGELDPEVLALENVVHKMMPAQEVGELPPSSLLVCDVNRDSRDICRDMLLPIAEGLKPGAPIILTLKFQRRLSKVGVQKIANDVVEIMKDKFEDFELMWLFGNTQNERTMIFFRKQDN